MGLSVDFIKEISQPELLRISPSLAHYYIIVNYCRRMRVSGLCTDDCNNCKPKLLKMVNLKEAIRPEALIISSANYQAAIAPEEKQANRLQNFPAKKAFFEESTPSNIAGLVHIFMKDIQ